jgi:predicted AAA+ superfamily ATPase
MIPGQYTPKLAAYFGVYCENIRYKECFAKNSYFIDLLDTDTEEKFSRNPEELRYLVEALDKKTSHIIIDEVQKIPRLLDLVYL